MWLVHVRPMFRLVIMGNSGHLAGGRALDLIHAKVVLWLQGTVGGRNWLTMESSGETIPVCLWPSESSHPPAALKTDKPVAATVLSFMKE